MFTFKTFWFSFTGKIIENSSFSVNTPTAPENSKLIFSVGWEVGSHVSYFVNFDNTSNLSWNYLDDNHNESYGYKLTTFEHIFPDFGNFTITVNISNEVSFYFHTLDIVIQPYLWNYVLLNSSWIPNAVPNLVTFEASIITQMLPSKIDIECLFTFNDFWWSNETVYVRDYIDVGKPLIIEHAYITDVPQLTSSYTCFNTFSNITYTTTVILREPISGLNIRMATHIWRTFVEVPFDLLLDTGSHVLHNISFGDGEMDLISYPNILSSHYNLTAIHTYTNPGNFTLSVYAYNEYFNESWTSNYTLIIQNKVENLTAHAPYEIPWPPGRLDVSINPSLLNPNATNLFCSVNVEDIFMFNQFVNQLSDGVVKQLSISLSRSHIGRNLSVQIECFNLVSSQLLNLTTLIYELIQNISVVVNPRIVTLNNPIDLSIMAKNGSNVTFVIDYGDNSMTWATHPRLFASDETFYIAKTYDLVGNFTISVFAHNSLSNDTASLEEPVIVQSQITYLTLTANKSVLYPPAEVVFTLQAGPQQSNITDMHCVWDYNDGMMSKYTFYEAINSTEIITHHAIFPRHFIGILNTVVNCSNLVSWKTLDVKTTISLDAVMINSLKFEDNIYWNHTTVLTLKLDRVAQHACYVWNMGDGTTMTVYGFSVCENVTTTDEGAYFVEIDENNQTLSHAHIFASEGSYTVTVYAFNGVSNDTIVSPISVKPWYCVTPNITLPTNVSSPAEPMIKMRSTNFTINPVLEVECLITMQVDYNWSVFTIDNPESGPVYTQLTGPEFKHPPRTLPIGRYFIKLYIEMHNIPLYNNTAMAYIDIIESPLSVMLEGASNMTLDLEEVYDLDAVSLSDDPDVEPGDKTGLIFTWYCRQVSSKFNNESVPTSGLNDYLKSLITNIHGCLGNPPGMLNIRDGIIDLGPFNVLLPDSVYHFKVVVTKDNRMDEDEKSISVRPILAPQFTTR